MLLAKVHDADHHLSRFEIQISNRLEETAMAYNHRKAELEWLRWKEQEEKQLRELGVDEDAIQRLHTYDWKQFNKERQYQQRWRDKELPYGRSPDL